MPQITFVGPWFPATWLLAVALVTTACQPAETAPDLAPQPQPVPVRLAPVMIQETQDTLRFAGVSRARQRAALTFQVGGVIQNRDAELGQTVTANQVLATLYNPQLEPARDAARSRLAQLQSDLDQASRERDRARQLHTRGVSPLQDLEQQETRVDSLIAAISNAEATLRQTEDLLAENALRAPFTGTIEAVLLEPGEFAQPGQAVMRIAASGGMEMEIRAPAHLLQGLRPGQALPVWSSLDGTELSGHIAELSSSSSGSDTLYSLIVSLDSADIRAGEAYEVGLPRSRSPALAIPVSAVMRSADGLSVFRFRASADQSHGQVSRVPVAIQALQGEYAVLGSDTLSPGDRLVYAGLTRLAEGDSVRVLP